MMGNRFEDEYDSEKLPRAGNLGPGFANRLFDRITHPTDDEVQPPEEVRQYVRQRENGPERQAEEEEHTEKLREAVRHVVTIHTEELRKQYTESKSRNQVIAEMIISLPYREAIAMGEGIAAKLGQGSVGGNIELSPEVLTRAIQAWAWEEENPAGGKHEVEKES
jgi:hypothetical protein